MKGLNIFRYTAKAPLSRLLIAAGLTISFLLPTQNVFADNGGSDPAYGAVNPSYKVSDSPFLKLSKDKLNWPPVKPPAPREVIKKSKDATAIKTYNVATGEITRLPGGIPTEAYLKSIEPYIGLLTPGMVPETVIPPDDRSRITPTTTYPWRTIVKLFMTASDGTHWVGSGAMIDAFHVLTAGHCVYMHDHGGWVTSIEAVPALDDDVMPYNHAMSTLFTIWTGWIDDQNHEHDMAIIKLDRNIGTYTGWMGRKYENDLEWYKNTFNSAGYPADLSSGLCMYFDSDVGYEATEYNHWYYMDTFGGQSGMPIWSYEVPNRYIVTVHAYGFIGSGTNHGTRINETKFNTIATILTNDAASPPVDYADLIDDGQTYSGFSPTTRIPGQTFQVYCDVRNIGTAASGAFNVSFYASTDATITTGDHLIGTDAMSSISPFTSADANWQGALPSIPAGTYYVGWIIDVNNDVTEFEEGNNIAYKTTYQLNVIDDHPPVLAPIGNRSTTETSTLQFTISATDPDLPDDVLTFSMTSTNLPTDATFNPATRTFNWATDYSDAGVYNATFRVDDAFGQYDDESITITVINLNRAPVLDPIGDQDGDENQLMEFTINADDPDPEDDITYTMTGEVPAGADLNPSTGDFSWTPGFNQAGNYDITFIATDNGPPAPLSDQEEIRISIRNVNRAPNAVGDNAATDEDNPLDIDVLTNDTDPDSDPLKIEVENPGMETDHGSLEIIEDPPGYEKVRYTPDPHFNGSDEFTYHVHDGEDISNSVTVSITVNAVNDAPVATGDAITVTEDGATGGDLTPLVTDVDFTEPPPPDGPEGDVHHYTVETDVAHGTLVINDDGTYTYTPDPHFNNVPPGEEFNEYFQYRVTDKGPAYAIATVTITVTPVNDAPVATDGSFDVDEDQTYTGGDLTTLVSDVDFNFPEGDNHTYSVTSDVSHGTLTLNPDGSYSYVPDAHFNGSDAFTYQVSDKESATATGILSITVNAVNDPPVAGDAGYDVAEEGTHNGDLTTLVTDIDFTQPPPPDGPEGDNHTYTEVSGVSHGTLIFNPDGSYSYTPELNYNGSDGFTYRVTDKGPANDDGVITFNVTYVEDNPVASPTSFEVDEGATYTSGTATHLTNYVTDPDLGYGDVHTYTIESNVSHGVLTLNTDGSFTYESDPDYNNGGPDEFTYRVTDQDGLFATALVSITVNNVNDPPYYISTPHVNAIEDQIYTYQPRVADYEGDYPVSWSLDQAPADMTIVSFNPTTGDISWTPTEGVNADVIVRATDTGDPAEYGLQPYTIIVEPVNDAPTIDPIGPVVLEEDFGTHTVDFSGVYGGDAELVGSQNISITATSSNQTLLPDVNITVNYNGSAPAPATGDFVLTSVQDHYGQTTVTVTVRDDNATPDPSDDMETVISFLVTVNPVNDAPVVSGIPDQIINEGQSFATVNLDDYVTDVDNDITTLTWTASEDSDLDVTITDRVATIIIPNADWFGSASITFTASDGQGAGQDEAIFVVHNVNDAPVVSNIPDQTIAEGETFATIPLDDYVEDIDNTDAQISWSYSGNSELSVSIDEGRVATIIIPDINWNGFETITFTAGDGEYEDSDHATFAVTAVNDAPVITSEPVTEATEDAAYTYNPTATDVENDALTWSLEVAPPGMTIDPGTGAISWTPPEGMTSAFVRIRVTDDGTPNEFGEQEYTINITQVNDAPVISSAPPTTATEQIEYVYNPVVDDPDMGDQHTWELVTAPAGMTIDQPTGAISWTPAEGVTTGDVTIKVTDDGDPNLSGEQSYTIDVTQVNDAPVITSTAPKFGVEDEEYTYFPQATDEDLPGDILTWSLPVAPAGMTIDPSTGAISWFPPNGITSADVTVRVTDNGTNQDNLYDEEIYTITITPVNDAPEITSTAPTTATEDVEYTYNPIAVDVDIPPDVLSWSLPLAPQGMSIEPTTGAITWTPGEGVTSEDVVVRVTDDGNPQRFGEQPFTITVTRVNDAPVITSTPSTDAWEDVEWVYDAEATDEDLPGDILTWSLVAYPTGMTIDPTTGVIRWTPLEGVTVGNVTVRVTDNGTNPDNQYAEQSFTINVTPVQDDPIFTNSPTLTATEDIEYYFDADAMDPDGDPLTFSISDKPSGMTINASTGEIRWTPTEGILTSGVVTLRVEDNAQPTPNFAELTFEIIVTPVNDAPVFTSQAPTTATEEVEYTYNPTATDAENDDLTWSLQVQPAGMTIDPSTGAISWTPAEGVTSANVTIRVTDDGENPDNQYAEQSYTINVTQVNDAPEITSEAIITATEDVEYTYDVQAEDVDLPGDVLTFTLEQAPQGMTIDAATGVITWTPGESPPNDPTVVDVQVRVTDNGTNPDNLSDDQYFQITVTPVNDAPEITSTPILTATEDVPYSYDVDATDVENNAITYSLVEFPAGMTINSETGLIEWTPADGQHGDNDVIVRVDDDGTDPDDAHSLQEFTIAVTPDNDDPTLDDIDDMTLTEDDPEQTVILSGIDDGDLGFSQILTITPTSSHPDRIHDPEIINYIQGDDEATMTFTPDPDANGVVIITITVEDDQGASVTTSFEVDIHPVNDAPTMTPIASPDPIPEDAGQQVITLTGINDGDPEIVQVLSMTAVSSDINVVHNPVVDLNAGTLTYTPVPDASGTVTITVTLTDDGMIPDIYDPPYGTIQDDPQSTVYTFEVRVLPVNDAPLIDQVADQTVDEDEPASQVVDLSGIADGDPDFVQNLTVTAQSNDEAMLTNVSVTYNPNDETGTLTYNVVGNASGAASITVTVSDNGGSDNGGVNSTDMTFNVNIKPSYDKPVVLPIAPQTAYVDNELVFTVNTDDPDGDVPTIAQPADLPTGAVFVDNGDGTGTFTWTPTETQIGEHTVTFIANDGLFDSDPVEAKITVEAMTSTITVTGLDENAHVYLYATSGWFGKWVFDGNSSVVVVAGEYLLCVRQDEKRTEYIPVTAPDNDEVIVEVTMYDGVPVLYGEKLALMDDQGEPINVSEFSSALLDDLDKDGDKDLIVATESGTVELYENNGTAFEYVSQLVLTLPEGEYLVCVRSFDYNEDNTLDYLYGITNGEIKVYNPEDDDLLYYTAEDGLTGFDLVDVNNDHAPDMILGYGDGTLDIDVSNGSGGWIGPAAIVDAGGDPISVVENAAPIGMDMNGDGALDLVVGNEDGTAQWFQNDGAGVFAIKGFVNANGEALAVTGDCGLSLSYGEAGELPEAVVTDNEGNVFQADVVLQGDITRDGTVDIFDLTVFGLKWSLTSEDPDWDGAVNLRFDGVVGSVQSIDIFDLTIFGMSWGLTLK